MLNFHFNKIAEHSSNMHNQLVVTDMTTFVAWKAINHYIMEEFKHKWY
jgi:hypothetical protein